MDNESNFDFSSDLGVSIYSIQYLLTILVRILFTSSSSSRETKSKDLQDSSIAKLLKPPTNDAIYKCDIILDRAYFYTI